MPTDNFAKRHFKQPPGDAACPVCGLLYVKGSPTDEQNHRSYHREVVETFEPRPNNALAKQHARHGVFVPVDIRSPCWMHKRLYRIALMLRRENGYDFPMWGERGDDGNGYIFTDAEGRALGGCAVRWREWKNATPGWVLQWIWVAPPHRRQGLMRSAWEMLTRQYEGIIPEPPLSRPAAQFFQGVNGLPERIRKWVQHTLATTTDPEGSANAASIAPP